ncbi:MAG: hypothetical protein ACKOW9_05875 [Candidatus Paceibacterota bacterium]
MQTFSKKIKENSIVASLEGDVAVRARIFQGMIGLFALLVLFYLFLLGSSVMNVVERKNLESEAHMLANEIGTLELEYLQISNTIDRELSVQMGFEEIAQNFATRKAATMMSKKLAKNEI